MTADQITKGFIQLDVENLQMWRLNALTGQPVLLLGCPPGENLCAYVSSDPFLFQLCLVLLPHTTEKGQGLSSQ